MASQGCVARKMCLSTLLAWTCNLLAYGLQPTSDGLIRPLHSYLWVLQKLLLRPVCKSTRDGLHTLLAKTRPARVYFPMALETY